MTKGRTCDKRKRARATHLEVCAIDVCVDLGVGSGRNTTKREWRERGADASSLRGLSFDVCCLPIPLEYLFRVAFV